MSFTIYARGLIKLSNLQVNLKHENLRISDKQLNKNTSHLINISPQTLMDWIQNGSVILADVRETGEFEID